MLILNRVHIKGIVYGIVLFTTLVYGACIPFILKYLQRKHEVYHTKEKERLESLKYLSKDSKDKAENVVAEVKSRNFLVKINWWIT